MPQTAADVEAELLTWCCAVKRLPCTGHAYVAGHAKLNDLLTLRQMLNDQAERLDA